MKRKTQKRNSQSTILKSSLPAAWVLTTVAAVGEIQVGRQLSPQYKLGVRPIPYIRAANITHTGLDLSEVLEMDFDQNEEQKFALRAGDILLAEASGSARHVGRSVIWNNELPRCCFQNTVIRFRSRSPIPEYAHIVFRFLSGSGELGQIARGVGILHLSAKRFAQLRFPLPPEAEQERIVRRVTVINGRLSRVKFRLEAAREKVQAHFRTAVIKILGLAAVYPETYG